MDSLITKKFRSVFCPDSIAVVGASKDSAKSGGKYIKSLVTAGFKGRLYPVNANENSILGLQSYPTVSSIPDDVHYVIIAIPAHSVLEVIDDCVAKKVKTIQIFTAGFRELGTAEGINLEQLIADKAKEAGINIIGPNCLGIYNPSANIPLGPVGIMGKRGTFGFASQSGGHGSSVLSGAIARGIGFSKAVSFGNGCGLNTIDFLEYYAADEDTEIIGAYLEGVSDGRRLYELISEITMSKPVLIWKGGKTSAGAHVTASHTASLATSYTIWKSAMKQAGAINVESFEEFIDTVLAFYNIRNFKGSRLAIISGIVDGGGGDSVSATDACISTGLEIPPFSDETRAGLASILRPVGTILHNPLDLGNLGANLTALIKAIELAASDPNIDMIIIQKHIDMLLDLLNRDVVNNMNEAFINLGNSIKKPIIFVSPPGIMETERIALDRRLSEAGLPVYPSLERAAKAVANMGLYYKYRATVSHS